MATPALTELLPGMFRELVIGSQDPKARTYVLNQGDQGLLASLDRLSAAAASATHGGASIAAHVDHLRYGLSLLNRHFAYHVGAIRQLDRSTRGPTAEDEAHAQ